MVLEANLARGEEVVLDLQDSARRRVICGLSWGMMADGVHAVARSAVAEAGLSSSHDLDLICVLFDKFGSFIDGVTGEEEFRTGDNGNIYHTGDVAGGKEVLDDEQISLELFNLSRKIHQIFFIAEVQSGENFGDVGEPRMHLANAADDRDVAIANLGGEAGADKNAYIFGSLRRHPKGWVFRYIGDYFHGADVTDWATFLREYIDLEHPDGAHVAVGPRTPAKGQTVPLHYSKEARQRVVCGLNWDPSVEQVGKVDKLKNRGQNIETYDLDLACVMYDANMEPVDGVSAKPDETIDSSGKVYHSGDHTSGDGDLDDEAVSVELRGLPDYIHHLVFIAEIQSLHRFKDINSPFMRIADGKTDHEQLKVDLTAPEGAEKNAYVFARISRKGERWTLTLIDQYFDGNKIPDWIGFLRRYLG